MATAVNLIYLLPKNIPSKLQSDFIENKLVFAIQQQGERGYDIREALRFMVNDITNTRFTEFDREIA